LVESSNKNVIQIIRKTIGDNKRTWDSCLKYALWADKITKKHATDNSPFELVYGLEVVLPINLRLPVYKLLRYFTTNQEALYHRIDKLVQLEEDKQVAFIRFTKYQAQVKRVFDCKAKGKAFQVGDIVLL